MVLTCRVRGEVPVPDGIPPIQAAVGLDRAPVAIDDEGEARWLEACVWPDQRNRLERLHGALALGREVGLDVRRGDAVADTPALVREVAAHGHPVVTNSWVLNYFTTDDRVAYLHMLGRPARKRDLSWVYVESPAQIGGLPAPEQEPERTVLSLVRWRGGRRYVDHLATCHPHGNCTGTDERQAAPK